MKLLCINPGSSWSTIDLYNGYTVAWREQGHQVIEYLLDRRLVAANRWLHYQWQRARRRNPEEAVRPTVNDVAYLASFESVIKALRQDVDWVIVFSALHFHPGVLEAMGKAGLRSAVLLTESPYQDAQQAPWAALATVAFTNERTSVEWLRQFNDNVHYLPHAYDPAKHFPGPDTAEGVDAHDVVFVGTDWPERVELFSAVNWEGIDLGLYGLWTSLGSRSRLRRYLRQCTVDNTTTAALYRRAKIGLNPYRQSVSRRHGAPRVTTAESLNPRAVELAASGCFHLCDWRPEVEEVFGDLVPTYRTPAEMEELIRYYLAHPEEREARARLLPERVKDRSFTQLGQQIIRVLEGTDG